MPDSYSMFSCKIEVFVEIDLAIVIILQVGSGTFETNPYRFLFFLIFFFPLISSGNFVNFQGSIVRIN